jgi:hypothetical protein
MAGDPVSRVCATRRSAESAEIAATIFAVKTVRIVFDDRDLVRASDGEDRFHFAADAYVMNEEDRLRALRNALFDQVLVDIQRVRADVHENGSRAAEDERVGGRDKGKRGQNYFVSRLDPQEERGHFQRMRAGGREERFRNPERLFEQPVALRGEACRRQRISAPRSRRGCSRSRGRPQRVG